MNSTLPAARPLQEHRSLILMLAVFFAVFGALVFARWAVWSYGTDTGIFTQAISATLRGYLDGPELGSHFCFHWSPIIGILAPLVWLSNSPIVVQLSQVLLIGATAIPVYLLVDRYAGRKTAVWCALITLLYAPLNSIAFEEFHELAFFPVLIMTMIERLDRRAWGGFVVAALAAMLVREDALMMVATTGLFVAAIGAGRLRVSLGAAMAGDKRIVAAGLGLAVAALVTMFMYFQVLIPHIGFWRPSHFYNYPFSNGPLTLLLALLTHPQYIGTFLTIGRGTYLLEAFAPLLLLPLRSWWLLPAIPGFLVILLSNSGFVWRMGDQYAALWIPWALLAVCDLLVRFARSETPQRAQQYYRGILGALLVVQIAFNPCHPVHYLKPAPHRTEALQALAVVPNDAHVLLHDEWYAHVELQYPNATVYPLTPHDWIVVDETYSDAVRNEWLPTIERERAAGEWQTVKRIGSVVVYRRAAGVHDGRGKVVQ